MNPENEHTHTISTPRLLRVAFFVCACLIIGAISTVFMSRPKQVYISLSDPRLVDGTLGQDPDGVWFDGNTRINVARFGDAPWRAASWRWHTPPGEPFPVTITYGSTQSTFLPSEQYRQALILLPQTPQFSALSITSETRIVPGDSRSLGVIVDAFRVRELPWSPLRTALHLGEYALLIVVAAWWLVRGRWLGFATWLGLCAVLVVQILQESAVGYAQPTLLLDRGGRTLCIALMVISAIRQRHRRISHTVPTGRRLGLDIMRAVAVLFVVTAHTVPLLYTEWSTTRDVYRWFVSFGGLGVDIFFALSGYLIGGIILRVNTRFGDFSQVTRFWQRRWLRTLPAAYVSAVVVWFFAPPTDLLGYFRSILFVGAVHPYYIAKDFAFWWSLATEELFYLLLPLAFWAVLRTTTHKNPFVVTIVGFATITLLGRVIVQFLVPSDALGGLEMTSINRLDSMVWGILIHWIRIERPHWFRSLAHIGYAPGLGMLVTGFILLVDQTRWYGIAMLLGHTLIVCGAALVIPAFEHVATLGWSIMDRLVRGIALVSFSLFLYHLMMQQYLTQHYGTPTTWQELVGLLVAYLFLSGTVATLSYRFVEVPMLRIRDTHFPDESLPTRSTH